MLRSTDLAVREMLNMVIYIETGCGESESLHHCGRFGLVAAAQC